MAITYDPVANKITVTGYTEVAPCTFNDLYDADKNGIFILEPSATYTVTTILSLDNQVRPADSVALKLSVDVSVSDGKAWSVTFNGQDLDGNPQSETVNTPSVGIFYTTKYYKSIDVNGITVTKPGGGISITLSIRQPRWGVISKFGSSSLSFDSGIIIGDGIEETWFWDKRKIILFTSIAPDPHIFVTDDYYQWITHLRLGILKNATLKTASDGVTIITEKASALIISSYGYVDEIYASTFVGAGNTSAVLSFYLYGKFYMNNLYATQLAFATGSQFDVFRVNSFGGTGGGDFGLQSWSSVNEFDDILIFSTTYGFATFATVNPILKNTRFRNNGIMFRSTTNWSGTGKFINVISDNWNFLHAGSSSGKLYRQYEFDLIVTDKDNNKISGATVTLQDKNGTQVFQVITDAEGKITTQTVSRGWYQQSTGDTLNDLSPHKLIIEKAGYQTYEKKFILDQKTMWQISLIPPGAPEAKADIVFIDGKPALNLSETDPENELYMVI